MTQKLTEAFVDMREEEVLKRTEELLEEGTEPMAILDACRKALDIIGKRFETGESFVPELIMAGEMMNAVTEMVKPKLTQDKSTEPIGKVLLGTVEGDIHDIGKDVVSFTLEANGFEVIDLGVDVPPDTFVQKIKEIQPDVIGLSGLLTLAFESMKVTVDAITEAGLRDQVKIMIGGAPVDELVREHSGADGWGKDAMEAVALAKQWIGA
jgi:5-methyltetrahydrofolate--homocysteine methyltransferase